MTETPDQDQPSIVFLGGVFLPSQHESILQHSHGVVQNAADALQKAFLRGFAAHRPGKVKLVNLPFVGSYPRMYNQIRFPGCHDSLPPGIEANGEGFMNLRFIRFWTRFFSAYRGLRRAVGTLRSPVIVVYSAHLPFLAAARLVGFFRKDAFLSVIVPDLPEFMGVGGRLYITYKAIESFLFRKIVRGFDSFVFLTDAMGERLEIPLAKRIVVEGIFDTKDDPKGTEVGPQDEDGFNILYTGTLAARYGIVDLLTAFEGFSRNDARLWICGDGDTRSVIENLAQRDPRVRYFGQVPRAKALALQRAASVLVNPRRPEGEFTKYSFPSKTMEYLASGKQVIMHGLPGIPPEYLKYLTIPATPDAAGITQALRDVSAMAPNARDARGAMARAFILSEKSPDAQVARVLDLWAELRDGGPRQKIAASRS